MCVRLFTRAHMCASMHMSGGRGMGRVCARSLITEESAEGATSASGTAKVHFRFRMLLLVKYARGIAGVE